MKKNITSIRAAIESAETFRILKTVLQNISGSKLQSEQEVAKD